MSNKPEFKKKVREVIRGIPCGQLATYGDVSYALTGNKDAAKAVGNAIGQLGNEFKLKKSGKQDINYHRVVYSTRIVPSKENAKALRDEGVLVSKGKVHWRVQELYFDGHHFFPTQIAE